MKLTERYCTDINTNWDVLKSADLHSKCGTRPQAPSFLDDPKVEPYASVMRSFIEMIGILASLVAIFAAAYFLAAMG